LQSTVTRASVQKVVTIKWEVPLHVRQVQYGKVEAMHSQTLVLCGKVLRPKHAHTLISISTSH
jgi:hypothetical protein